MRSLVPAIILATALPALALPDTAAAQIPIYQRHFDGSPAGDGRGRPRDIVVEPGGTVLVLDTESGCLHRFSAAGAPQGSLGGLGTEPGRFTVPTGVAVDAAGAVWVAEAGWNRVQKLSPAGDPLLQLGQASATASAAPGRFDGPTAVAVGGDGTVYVADAGNHRIQLFSPTGAYLASFGTVGSAVGEFHFPEDVWVHGGRVYVLDRGNLRVQMFTAGGLALGAFGRSGAGAGEFFDPTGLTVAADGTVHVVDAGAFRVQVFSPEGAYLGTYGALGKGEGDFIGPVAVAAGRGDFYVADSDRREVIRFDLTTPVQATSWGGLKLAFASGGRR